MEINGAVSIITGGAKGLGLAIAEHLLEQGARVVVADLDSDAVAELPDGIEGHVLDVTDPGAVKAVVGTVLERHGRIDALVNNAGVIYSEPMVNITNMSDMMHSYDRFRKSIAINMDSVFIVTAAVVEKMVINRTKGAIVNISSISACGNEGQTAYSAAKAGVNAMTVTWSKELGKLGIRCNAVAPGFVDTSSTSHALSESIVKHIRMNTPLHRLGRPEEIALAVSSVIANDFMNGAIIHVDGGLSI